MIPNVQDFHRSSGTLKGMAGLICLHVLHAGHLARAALDSPAFLKQINAVANPSMKALVRRPLRSRNVSAGNSDQAT